MPRKLSDHSQLLLFYLKNLLPSNWKIIPLENVSENYLIKSLSRKSKFIMTVLSFTAAVHVKLAKPYKNMAFPKAELF